MQFVNYAHRGASHYAPENTMMAFYLGVWMGANGIETDVHLTKDGALVLFHDDSLVRVTGESGNVSDYMLQELKQFTVKKEGLCDKIPTLDEFLKQFGYQDLTFAIELKQTGTAEPTADRIRSYGIGEKTVITSFDYQELCRCCAYAPELHYGYLTSGVTQELLADMQKRGITQLCPKADGLTAETVARWHAMGFSVRAWGVSDEALMQHAYLCGVDGMTVNFPDKLVQYREKCQNG